MKKPKQLSLFDDLPLPGNGSVLDSGIGESERKLIAVAVALGAREVPGWSDAEDYLTRDLPPVPSATVADVR